MDMNTTASYLVETDLQITSVKKVMKFNLGCLKLREYKPSNCWWNHSAP